jgi:copper chaperone
MEKLQFKTNIKCAGCIAATTPNLNEAAGKDNWEVDIQDPNKILTITAKDGIEPARIIKAVESAGYKAEIIEAGRQ